jgi:hypothetical protein
VLRALVPAILALVTLQPSGDGWSRVESFYRQRVQSAGIVGSSLMFVKDGRVVHQAFEGYQDRDARRSVDENVRVHLAPLCPSALGLQIGRVVQHRYAFQT